MQTLTPQLLAAAGFPAELQPCVDRGALVFSHARPDGTLVFTIPHEAEPRSAFDLIWHPAEPATWDYEALRFHVREEQFRDVDHYDPVGSEILDLPTVEDLTDWLDALPAQPAATTPESTPVDRQAAGYLPACPHCRGRGHIRELNFWTAASQAEPGNTCTVVEYQCHAPGCDGEPFWL